MFSFVAEALIDENVLKTNFHSFVGITWQFWNIEKYIFIVIRYFINLSMLVVVN